MKLKKFLGIGGLALLAISPFTCKPCNEFSSELIGKNVPYLLGSESDEDSESGSSGEGSSPSAVNPVAPVYDLNKSVDAGDEYEEDEEDRDASVRPDLAKPVAKVPAVAPAPSPAPVPVPVPSVPPANPVPAAKVSKGFKKVGIHGNLDVLVYEDGLVKGGETSGLYALRFNNWNISTHGGYAKITPGSVYNNNSCRPQKVFMKGSSTYVCALPSGSSIDGNSNPKSKVKERESLPRKDAATIGDLKAPDFEESAPRVITVVAPVPSPVPVPVPSVPPASPAPVAEDDDGEDDQVSNARGYGSPFGIVQKGDPVGSNYAAVIQNYIENFETQYRSVNSGNCLVADISLRYTVNRDGKIVDLKGKVKKSDSTEAANLVEGLVNRILRENKNHPLESVRAGTYPEASYSIGCD